MCLGVDLLGLNLLGKSLCLLNLDLFPSLDLGSFQLLFLQIHFLSFFFFWDIPIMQMSLGSMVSLSSSLFSLCGISHLFSLNAFHYWSSRSHICSSDSCSLLFIPSIVFLISCIEVSICYFLPLFSRVSRIFFTLFWSPVSLWSLL